MKGFKYHRFKGPKHYFLMLVAFLMFSVTGFSQVNYLRGSSEIVSGSFYYLNTDKYQNVSLQKNYQQSSPRIELSYDNLHISDQAGDFVIEVDVRIYQWAIQGQQLPSQDVTLKIEHKRGVQKVVQSDVFISPNTTVHRFKTEVLAVRGAEHLTDDIVLKSDFKKRVDISGFNNGTVLAVGHTEDAVNNEITFYWDYYQGADYYELEFVHLSSEVQGSMLSYSELAFERATRVITKNQYFTIGNTYPSGEIYYRVRPVQENESYSPSRIFRTSSWKGNVGNTIQIGDNYFEKDKNWSAQRIYGDNGLKSEVISYVDGTGRVRQEQVKDDYNGNLMVSEQFYGFNGEPSIQTLPGIVPGNDLGYKQGVTTSGGQPYSRENFATDDKLFNPDPLDANMYNYFSSGNVFKGDGLHDYVPDAEGYGFMQSVFDVQGRVTEVSGLGEKLKMGGGHEVVIEYGNVAQDEIDRLFGNEVGYADHYSKVQTQDENGVITTSYYNLSGQLIATALAGSTPESLEGITTDNYDQQDDVVQDLSSHNQYMPVGRKNVLNYDFLVNTKQVYKFNYRLTKEQFEAVCTSENYDCSYDLVFSLSDKYGNPKVLEISPLSNEFYSIDSEDQSIKIHVEPNVFTNGELSFTLETSEQLEVGQYKLYKELSISDEGYQVALAEFRDDLENGTNSCVPSYDEIFNDLIQEELKGLRCDPCEELCASTVNQFYTLSDGGESYNDGSQVLDFEGYSGNSDVYDDLTAFDDAEDWEFEPGLESLWQEKYKGCLLEKCIQGDNLPNLNLDNEIDCEGIKDILTREMQPGGQYYENRMRNQDKPASAAWMIANVADNSNNGFPLVDLSPGGTAYTNWNQYENITNDFQTDDWGTIGNGNWWRHHPEACEYVGCDITKDYLEFGGELLQMDLQDAIDAFGGNPLLQGNNYLVSRDNLFFANTSSIEVIANGKISSAKIPFPKGVLDPMSMPNGIDGDYSTYMNDYLQNPVGKSASACSTATSFAEYALCVAKQSDEFETTATDIPSLSVEEQEVVWEFYKRLYLAGRSNYISAIKTAFKEAFGGSCYDIPNSITEVVLDLDKLMSGEPLYTYTDTELNQEFEIVFPDFWNVRNSVSNATDVTDILNIFPTPDPCNQGPEWSKARYANWYFGQGLILNFGDGSETGTILSLLSDFSGQEYNSYVTNYFNYEGSSSISTKIGQLEYMTNGLLVSDELLNILNEKTGPYTNWSNYDVLNSGNESPIDGGNGTFGSSSAQGVMFVKHPNDKNKYYVFTTDDEKTPMDNHRGFNYRILDATTGELTNSVKIGDFRTREGLTATTHSNGKDIWILVQPSVVDDINTFQNPSDFNQNNKLYAYLLTEDGVSSSPVISDLPDFNVINESVSGFLDKIKLADRGMIKVSWGKDKLAISANLGYYYANHSLILADFDNSTGVCSNIQLVGAIGEPEPDVINYVNYYSPYGIEFSPNDEILYVTTVGQAGSAGGKLYAFEYKNKTKEEINLGGVLINDINEVLTGIPPYIPNQIKLGGDGALYQATSENLILKFEGDLNSPFDQNGVSLLTMTVIQTPEGQFPWQPFWKSQIGLPNMYLQDNCFVEDSLDEKYNCFCSDLIGKRNEYWQELNPDASEVAMSWTTSFTDSEGLYVQGDEVIAQRILDDYKLQYPYLLVDLGNDNIEMQDNYLDVNTHITTWMQGCMSEDYSFFDVEDFGSTSVGLPYELYRDCPNVQSECYKDAIERVEQQASLIRSELISAELDKFKDLYYQNCMRGDGSMEEEIGMEYLNKEYQYTLYYYDLAGNLVSTVMPEGVRVLDETTIDQVQAYRQNQTGSPIYLEDQHVVAQSNVFEFNTLGGVTKSKSVDAGESEYYYDNLGRIVASQNAEQKLENKYSYSKYDDLSRVIETGELELPFANTINGSITREIGNSGVTFDGLYAISETKEVTRVEYDKPLSGLQSDGGVISEFAQYGKNDGERDYRNRITGMFYYEDGLTSDGGGYDMAYYYAYNDHGMVETFSQEHSLLTGTDQEFKTVNYHFDIFTGLTQQVDYQPTKTDALYTKYEYDGLQRLNRTYTSTNKEVWNLESKNVFFNHGAKARVELGKHQIQGLDIAYTVRGEVKALNSATLDATRDIGADGRAEGTYTNTALNGAQKKLNKGFARDVAGFALNYFNGDYKSVGVIDDGYNFNPKLNPTSSAGQSHNDLYNGMITSSATAIYIPGEYTGIERETQLSTYDYDMLYRLKEVEVYRGNDVLSSNHWDNSSLEGGSKQSSAYYTSLSYDLNGNITALQRNSSVVNGQTAMDALTYHYLYNDQGTKEKLLNNRLYHVDDAVQGSVRDNDYDADDSFNASDVENGNDYQYNALGNVVENKADGFSIEWTANRKVKRLTRYADRKGPNVEFKYDALGRRICKIIKNRPNVGTETTPVYQEVPTSEWEWHFYGLDASGATMATYTHKLALTSNTSCTNSDKSFAVRQLSASTIQDPFSSVNVDIYLPNGTLDIAVIASESGSVTLAEDIVNKVNSNSSRFTAELIPEAGERYIKFTANATGNVYDGAQINIYSASGNKSAYIKPMGGAKPHKCYVVTSSELNEQMIYADARLGNIKRDIDCSAPPVGNRITTWAGDRYYEITNWLGSVISVVRDMKYWTADGKSVQVASYYSSFEGCDENQFNGVDGDYNQSTEEAYNGQYSLKLDASAHNGNHFGPNVRQEVKVGDLVDISAYTLWYGDAQTEQGGGIVYALIDENGNFLYHSNGTQEHWNYISLQPIYGDQPGSWNYNSVDNWVVPQVYDANGQVYTGKITFHSYAWNHSNSNVTYYDEYRVEVTPSSVAGQPAEEGHYVAVIAMSSDYHAFGMQMAGRGIKGDYRYGYQGSELDNEIAGDGNSYTTEFRQLDPRLGRWFSVDPVFQPWQSPYTSMDNNPVNYTDVFGNCKDCNSEGLEKGDLAEDENGKIWVYGGLDENGEDVWSMYGGDLDVVEITNTPNEKKLTMEEARNKFELARDEVRKVKKELEDLKSERDRLLAAVRIEATALYHEIIDEAEPEPDNPLANFIRKLESKLLPGVDMYTERPGAGIIPKRKGGEETPMSNIDEMLDLLETYKPKLSGRAKKLYDKLVKLKEKAEKINEEFDKKIDEAIEKLDYAEEKLTIAIEVLRAVEKRLNEGKQMGLIMHTGDTAIIFDDGSVFDPTGSLAPVNSNDTIYFDKK